MKRAVFIQLLFFAGFWIVFLSLQHPFIYHRSLGLISDNWGWVNGERLLIDEPYQKLNNTNYIHWDAAHYQLIKEYGYSIEKAGSDYIFAFFPFFPFIWKILHIPPVGILFMNYLFMIIAVSLLMKLFLNRDDYVKNSLIALSFPMIIIFFIPYTEATFLLTSTIAIFGFMKKKYWLYFTGFVLASLTRPTFTILLLSIICTEFFFLFDHRRIGLFLKNTMFRILPLIVGTILLSSVQLYQGSDRAFKFIEVQKYWGHVFSLPHDVRDWSHEGYGIHLGVIFMIFIPLLFFLLQKILLTLKRTKSQIFSEDRNYYSVILSVIYIIGISLFVIFFQDGSLHNLFRYSLATPFFFILLFGGGEIIKNFPVKSKIYIFIVLSIISFSALALSDYSSSWNYSDSGLFLLMGSIFLWVFQEYFISGIYRIFLFSMVCLNILWTTYLFNMYINNGWIFA